MKLKTWMVISLVVLSFLLSAYFYPQLPGNVASHWGTSGEVNDYLPKFWGAFLVPLINLIVAGILILGPKIDPLKKNIKLFRKEYFSFVIVIIVFLIVIQTHMLLWNVGYQFSIYRVLPLALGFLFFFIGLLLEKSKRNWFIGIRTPWTMSSDKVWKKTHNLGGKLFKISGGICAIGFFFNELAIWFMLTPIVLSGITLTIYSYIEYLKEKK